MKKKILIITPLVLFVIVVLASWIAGSFLSAPANEPVGNLPPDLDGNSVQFQSESGTTLHGWLIPGRKGMGAIVLMHGVRANRLSNVSMGGAAALLAVPVLDVDAMVLEMVYPTANQAIRNRLIVRFGRPGKLLVPLLSWQLKPRLGAGADDLRPIDKVGQITMPKLFIGGSDDSYTPLAESQQMFEMASNPKDFWIVNGAGHQDLYRFIGSEYEQRILNFFSRYL